MATAPLSAKSGAAPGAPADATAQPVKPVQNAQQGTNQESSSDKPAKPVVEEVEPVNKRLPTEAPKDTTKETKVDLKARKGVTKEGSEVQVKVGRMVDLTTGVEFLPGTPVTMTERSAWVDAQIAAGKMEIM